jgi:hypothetical protein
VTPGGAATDTPATGPAPAGGRAGTADGATGAGGGGGGDAGAVAAAEDSSSPSTSTPQERTRRRLDDGERDAALASVSDPGGDADDAGSPVGVAVAGALLVAAAVAAVVLRRRARSGAT